MNIEISPLLRRCLNVSSAELSTEFRGVFSRETVARYLEDSVERIGERPTIGPNFLPVIIERFARDRLWAVAHAEQRVEKGIPEVLIVCEHNAGRSQIAAALTHTSPGESLTVVRELRDQIYHHVWDLLETLVPTGDLLVLHRRIGGAP